MPVVRRSLYVCAVLIAASIVGGCTTTKKLSSSVADLFTRDAPEQTQPAEPEAPIPGPVVVTPEPEPVPEAAPVMIEAAPAPEAEPDMPVADAPLPPGGDIIFEDEMPEVTAPAVSVAPRDPETYEVVVPDGIYAFVPRELTIYEGDTVVWKNSSGIIHLFASIPGADSSGKMEIEPVDLLVGEQITHTFTKNGEYLYFCFIHNRMTGKVTVLPR